MDRIITFVGRLMYENQQYLATILYYIYTIEPIDPV
jgi:hypothetical protein